MIRHPFAAATALALLVAWAPLPFASVTPGFAAFLQIAAFLLAAAVPWLDPASTPPRGVTLAAAALAGIALLGLLQSLSWPIGLVAALSPEHARFARESAALLGAPEPTRAALSLAPAASRAAALDWLLPAAGLLVAARLGASRRVRRALAAALVGGALFQILYGARQWFARSNAIWGIETPLQALRLRGTFVNPNHLALYLEIALAVGFAALWWTARRAASESGAERRLARVGPAALLFVALSTGLAFTGSRAGALAALAGAGATLAIAARGRRAVLALGAAALVLALAATGWLGFDAAFGRLLGTSIADVSAHSRIEATARTLELAGRFPATGVGLGGFLAAFPLVQGERLEGLWRHAHDDWAELLATTGVTGFTLFVLGLAALAAELVRAGRAAPRGEDRAAVAAAGGALTAVALHSLVDFGLTMPANAWTLAVVAGAGAAAGAQASASSRGFHGSRMPADTVSETAASGDR